VTRPNDTTTPDMHTVLIHTPAPEAPGGWVSNRVDVVRIPRVGEHVAHGGALYVVELVIHPVYDQASPVPELSYTAELCCVPVAKQAVLERLTTKAAG
jgi:hypothetical protein